MATVSPAQEVKDFGNFELLTSFDLEYAPVKVSKWRSKRTGLTVVVGGHKGASIGLNGVTRANSQQPLSFVNRVHFGMVLISAVQTNGYFVVASESMSTAH
jgi:hypothetical protein